MLCEQPELIARQFYFLHRRTAFKCLCCNPFHCVRQDELSCSADASSQGSVNDFKPVFVCHTSPSLTFILRNYC